MRYLYNIVDCSKDLKEFEFFLLDKYMTEKEIQIFFKNDNYRILQVKPIPDEMLDPKFKEELKMTFQQVESEALASKVVFPSDSMISYAAATSEAIADKNNETWNYPICFIKGAQWLRSQITLAPKEQVTSECKLQGHKGGWDENGTSYCTTCDGSAPKEPEVKAQGFDEWADSMGMEPCGESRRWAYDAWQAAIQSIMPTPEEAKQYAQLEREILAGQKSKAATLRLPDEEEQRKFVDLHFCHSGLEYNSWGYVGKDALELLKKFCDAVKSMNEGDDE